MASGEDTVRFGLEQQEDLGWSLVVDAAPSIVGRVENGLGLTGQDNMPFLKERTPENEHLTLLHHGMDQLGEFECYARQRMAVQYLGALAEHLSPIGTDLSEGSEEPIRRLIMAPEPLETGALLMYAEVARPESDQREVSSFAGDVMRDMAKRMGYLRNEAGDHYDRYIRDRVTAVYDHDYLTLFADRLRSCVLQSDAGYFGIERQYISLISEHLVSHSQQLICFAGLVAVSQADIFVK